MSKRSVWCVVCLTGFALLVGIFLWWKLVLHQQVKVFLSDSKLPRVAEASVESFRATYREKSTSGEESCFNTWSIHRADSQKLIYGMNSPGDFGRIRRESREDGLLWLASGGGTTFEVLFIPQNLRTCEEMASVLSGAQGYWQFEGLVTGYQDQGAYFEQRTYNDPRNVPNRASKIFHHCQRYADGTVSSISYVNPEDPVLSVRTVSELLKTVRISYEQEEVTR
jgi:hypothetical protein